MQFLHSQQATAEASNLILYNDCLALYETSMKNNINNKTDSYFDSSELEEIHQQVKNDSISKV